MRDMSDVLADTKVSMVDILLNLQVSATRAGNHEMGAWGAKEGTGYAENDELPAHRMWPLRETRAHASLKHGGPPKEHTNGEMTARSVP